MADGIPLTSSWADADPDAEGLPDILLDNIPKLEISEEDMIQETVEEPQPVPVQPPRPNQQPPAGNSWLRRGPPQHKQQSQPNNKQGRRGFQNQGGFQRQQQQRPPQNQWQLQFDNIVYGAQESDLQALLNPFNPTKFFMLRDRGNFKGSVNVHFANEQDMAKAASELHGTDFMGRALRVGAPRGQRGFHGGRGNGYRDQRPAAKADFANKDETQNSERPRLILKPRTVSRPVGQVDDAARSAGIFGAAKPRAELVGKSSDPTQETEKPASKEEEVVQKVEGSAQAPEDDKDGFISVPVRGANKGRVNGGGNGKGGKPRGNTRGKNNNNNRKAGTQQPKQWQKKSNDGKQRQEKSAPKPNATAKTVRATEEPATKAKAPLNRFAFLDDDDSD